jgi:hypothetical protein
MAIPLMMRSFSMLLTMTETSSALSASLNAPNPADAGPFVHFGRSGSSLGGRAGSSPQDVQHDYFLISSIFGFEMLCSSHLINLWGL